MSNQYNIGRTLTDDELAQVAAYHNWDCVEQDYEGNLDHDGQPVTAQQVIEALNLKMIYVDSKTLAQHRFDAGCTLDEAIDYALSLSSPRARHDCEAPAALYEADAWDASFDDDGLIGEAPRALWTDTRIA